MARISSHLLKQIARHIAEVPATPEDLALAATQLGPQVEGLARLDELNLASVEPATVVPLPTAEQQIHG